MSYPRKLLLTVDATNLLWIYIVDSGTILSQMDHHKVNHKKAKRDKKRKLEAERAVGPDTSEFVGAVESIMNGHNDSTDGINESKNAAVLEDSHISKKSRQEKAIGASDRSSSVANNNASSTIPTLPGTKKERVIKPSSLWNFTVDYNDHFETPPIAYKDLSPVLEALSAGVGKTTGELTIYDPYWCEGSMVSHMRELGYENVINRNRDFYMDIKKKNIPGAPQILLSYLSVSLNIPLQMIYSISCSYVRVVIRNCFLHVISAKVFALFYL